MYSLPFCILYIHITHDALLQFCIEQITRNLSYNRGAQGGPHKIFMLMPTHHILTAVDYQTLHQIKFH